MPGPWDILVCSKLGAVFLEKEDGAVLWLETATSLVEPAADSRELPDGASVQIKIVD